MGRAATTPQRVDITVVGAGAAGLFCALVAAGEGAHVALVSRSPLPGSASYWAQGGIAAALSAEDSPDLHAADTLAAGRAAARGSAVAVLTADSPARVAELVELGVGFDRAPDGSLELGLEGGHSVRRVAHADGAATGRRITSDLAKLASAHPRIDVLEATTADALLTDGSRCLGIGARGADGAELELRSAATVLATGGAAAAWARSSNPPGSVGVAIVLAHAAGAEVADLELTQFHPTALVAEGERDGFLITEAIRGEGALLLDGSGERFVDELAPRDEVATAIEAELRRTGARSVALDVRPVDMARFPNIAKALAAEGIDPRRDTVPVAPAAHYSMGGVATDIDGRSSLAGLLAVGESACTGLHGANRLASNSLAECFVLGRRAALAACTLRAAPATTTPMRAPLAPAPDGATRAALWRHAGLVRDAAGLHELATDPHPFARLVAACALERTESRGAHQRRDYADTDPDFDGRHVVVDGSGAVSRHHWE